MFEPHLLIIPLGSTVSFPNLDPFFHNVFSQFNGKRFDLGLYEAGSTRDVRFDHEGVSYLFCNIHPEIERRQSLRCRPSIPGMWSLREARSCYRMSHQDNMRFMSGQKARMRSNFVRLPIGCVSALTQNNLGTISRPAIEGPPHRLHKNKFGEDYRPQSNSPY